MQLFQPLLADVNWIQVIIVIFVLLGPLIGKFGGGNKKPKAQQRRAPRRPPLPPPAGQPQAGAQPALQKEIDDFLRQAQARGGGQRPAEQRPAEQRPAEQRPAEQRPAGQRPPRVGQPKVPRREVDEEAARRRARQQAQKKQALIKRQSQLKRQGQRGPQRREGVAEHVETHIKSKPVSDHGKQLGQRLRQTDENVEEHLHEVFDHKVGELGETLAQSSSIRQGTDDNVWENVASRRARDAAAVELRTADIARMILDPVSMREAIILAEILKPPKSFD